MAKQCRGDKVIGRYVSCLTTKIRKNAVKYILGAFVIRRRGKEFLAGIGGKMQMT